MNPCSKSASGTLNVKALLKRSILLMYHAKVFLIDASKNQQFLKYKFELLGIAYFFKCYFKCFKVAM